MMGRRYGWKFALVMLAVLLAGIGGGLFYSRQAVPVPPPAESAAAAAQPTALPGPPEVSRRDKTPDATPLPSGDFARDRAELERRVRGGDTAASLRLARILTSCSSYRPVTDAEIENRLVDRLARERTEPLLDGKPLPPDVLLDQVQRKAGELAVLCAGTKKQDFDRDNDLKTALGLLRRAADAGDAEATLEFVGLDAVDMHMMSSAAVVEHAEDVRERKRRVTDYLSRLLASGDARVLKAYGDEHLYGRLYPRNPQKAYAYYYAYAQSGAAQTANPWTSRMPLQYPESQLTPEQIAQAQREGMALLADCCGAAAPRP